MFTIINNVNEKLFRYIIFFSIAFLAIIIAFLDKTVPFNFRSYFFNMTFVINLAWWLVFSFIITKIVYLIKRKIANHKSKLSNNA